MEIKNFILGAYQTNSYCLRLNDKATDCVIIDTGLEDAPLIDYLQQEKLNPEAVILTHGHSDHTVGLIALRKAFPDIKVAIHKDDDEMLADPVKNLSAFAGITFTTDPADIIIESETELTFAGITLQVLHTPGHTPGGISLYVKDEDVVFVGDSLFEDSIGRTDFPGGSHSQLINSIKTKLLTLPENTKAFPGHGGETTIGQEKKYNPFLR